MNRKGITLIELIIVLVIICIGAALMVPGFGTWMPRYRLRGATRDIVSVMRTAQMRAVSNNMRYGVAFDTQQFQLYRDSGGLQVDGAPVDLPHGVTYAANFPVEATLGKPFIQFLPDSTASANGSVILNNNKGMQKRIQVTMSTGRITIQ